MSSPINNALSGLLAAQRGLNATSNNIANVGTEGYSRQRIQQVAGPVQGFGSLQFGTGVLVVGVERIYDQLLANQLTTARSSEGRAEVANQYALRLEGLLGSTEAGISGALQAFFDQVNVVANDPSSTVNRQQLLGEADALAQRFAQLAGQLDSFEAEINQRLTASAATVNEDLRAIAELNSEIVANGLNPSNTLLDQRQVLVDRVARQIDVQRIDQADGSVNITTSNGQPLVLGVKSFAVGVQRDAFDPLRLQLTASDGTTTSVISRQVAGGEIGGLLSFRDTMLDTARRDLGRVALGLAETFNQQNAAGLDLNGNLGGDFFTVADPQVLPSASNTGAASVSAVLADVSAVAAREYNLRFAGGVWTLTDAGSGAPLALSGSGTPADPFVAAGMELTVAGIPAAGDVFRVRPTNNAAAGLDVALTDPSLIAAAAPLETADVIANVGSASVTPATVDDLTNPDLLTAVRIRFDDPPTSYQITAPDGTPLTGSLPYTSGADISFNGWTVQVSGTPRAGDQFTVGSAGANSGGNANALELAAL
ncbi:MAG: flagellar hook-associated protein FlgK, partial [Gammaproteobacteria bacterium]|nr:flagellar hook-associated protein FlgK [Gammaproteobacteria bacterium]